jgi:phosphate transport system permease protein
LIHRLSQHDGPVREILPSERNKSLLSLGDDGTVLLDYMTSEKKLATLADETPVRVMAYSPRGNAMAGLDADRQLRIWHIDSPHPEVSWQVLFGKVWYDGHDEPKYLWQSSGTDEPKFSLVPVIFGTLKATIYAMCFAVPLALFSAMYVSHFTTPGFKRAIKPVVEVMAAIPTVVVGFLILLWAAPLMGNWVVGLFLSFVTIPIAFLLFMMIWQPLRRFDFAKWVENGYEFIVLVFTVVPVGALAAIALTGPVESWLFAGDFRQWLFDTMNMRYDQLNSLVVALGLGFAVVPIIFSISEDSLSDIPHSLTAASLAMGASRWQTVWRVILPSASPGIFAAAMIGFGRAVGETMIVFMATGNTPILDWSPFNGFRTLSANIAVEISEAPRDGTLYRVLFLCAVLLFTMTFLLNTVAELVRTRLRKKYGRL